MMFKGLMRASIISGISADKIVIPTTTKIIIAKVAGFATSKVILLKEMLWVTLVRLFAKIEFAKAVMPKSPTTETRHISREANKVGT